MNDHGKVMSERHSIVAPMPQKRHNQHSAKLRLKVRGDLEATQRGGFHMTALSSTGRERHGIGIRRRGLGVKNTTRWYFYLPNDLYRRFDNLISSQMTHKAVYGLISVILTDELKRWLAEDTGDFTHRTKGWRRPKHDALANNTRLSAYVPDELAAMVSLRFTKPGGGILRFQTPLLTILVRRWVEEREAKLAEGIKL